METGFTVYDSFMNYKSGVYERTWFDVIPKGGHAVKVIGWGKEDEKDYWLCANSWNTSWGDNGLFKIRMGSCGIDTDLYACYPKTEAKESGFF